MITAADVESLSGAQVVERDGQPIGTVGQVFLSEDGQQPLFVTVRVGGRGATESFVPLQSAELRDGTLQVAYDLGTITSAPSLDSDRPITDDEQGTIFDYYDGRAGGSPSGEGATPAGLSDTPEERTVAAPSPERPSGIAGEPLAAAAGDQATS